MIKIIIILIIILIPLIFIPNIENFNNSDDSSIFVSVASYRDSKCLDTINSIFSNATFPDKITVGICQQNDNTKDIDCEDPKWKHRIKIIRLPYWDAKGPTWARYLCSTLVSDEKYFLQIDSHTLFVKDWDTKCINMIKELKQKGIKKPLLSHYPKTSEEYNKNGEETTIPVICKSFFNEQDMISFLGANNLNIEQGKFKPTPYIAAGMLFAESSFLKEVPFDPNLPFLFVGEEILHSIRFWTHGWDIFTPSENIIYHYYTRENDPKIWNDSKHYDYTDADNKVRVILGLNKANPVAKYLGQNMELYGLGKNRSLEKYFEFAGIDLKNKTVTRDFCHDTDISEVFTKYQ